MNFSVKRSEWLRGAMGGSFLLRKVDNKKCCLGFLALACGATEESIFGHRMPASLQQAVWPKELFNEEGLVQITQKCINIMSVNDEVLTSDLEKEDELTRQFADIGITINFED